MRIDYRESLGEKLNDWYFSDLVARVIFDMQPDPTDPEDSLHTELFQGRTTQVLAMASEIDVWLSAHLADLMLPLGLIDSEIDEE